MLQLQKKQQLVLLIVAAVFLFGSGYQYARWHAVKNTENAVLIPAEEEKDKDNQNRVFVHVAGAVKNPGVYQLPGGARVKDALQKAELLPEADVTQVNLAQILKDEQKIQVYYQKTDSDEAVSYTHLDVYKRQGPTDSKGRGKGSRKRDCCGQTDRHSPGGRITFTVLYPRKSLCF